MTLRRLITLTLPLAALAAATFLLQSPPPQPASPQPPPHGPLFLSHDWIELPPRQTLAERLIPDQQPLGCDPDDPASRCRNCMRIRLFGAVL